MICYILCGVIILQSIIHAAERKDLYNRIMSKNLAEYKGEMPRRTRSTHERLIQQWRGKGGENK